jgi:L,D-transpeptidase ErfK/SrfK
MPGNVRTVSFRAVVAVLLVSLFSIGCQRIIRRGEPVSYDEETFAAKTLRAYPIPVPSPKGAPAAVIGRVQSYRVQDGDTLLDIARLHDLGYNEITQANPGVDPWLPPIGETVVLPTSWVLPCCTVEGLVLNIPEMRLYFYRRKPANAPTVLVITHPVGIGPQELQTPRGVYKVRGKSTNPTWFIPDSIRQERIQERGDDRRAIRGGDPENPLGKYRFELTRPRYVIHGTNAPWGIGRQVSHGCARLYPEDIERLFPHVPVGTRVEFTYQPFKVGVRDGVVFLEVHADIYGYSPPTYENVLALLKRKNLQGRVDEQLIRAALKKPRGVPVRVSPS